MLFKITDNIFYITILNNTYYIYGLIKVIISIQNIIPMLSLEVSEQNRVE